MPSVLRLRRGRDRCSTHGSLRELRGSESDAVSVEGRSGAETASRWEERREDEGRARVTLRSGVRRATKGVQIGAMKIGRVMVQRLDSATGNEKREQRGGAARGRRCARMSRLGGAGEGSGVRQFSCSLSRRTHRGAR
eukprot:ctg_770.g205